MKPKTRRVAVIALSVGAVVLVLDVALTQLPNQQWWPGWVAIGGWLGQWWPLLLAMALAAGAAMLVRVGGPRSTATTPMSMRWESELGHPGLLPRATVTPSVTSAPAQRWNWTAITSVVTAATALAALGFTAQSLSATREQINLSEQGQITDRYTKAIDQLGTQGADHLQTRLGGIYALERLAGDSSRDQPTIIEILSAFVRSALPTAVKQPNGTTTCPTTTDLQVDVRAALSVLGRRNHDYDRGTVSDLHGVCLTATDLTNAKLDGANLTGANLVHAGLFGADLDGAHLVAADLYAAHLNGANLAGANLAGAHLTGASLDDANLTGADLNGSELLGTHLTNANLDGANLSIAYLNGTHLNGAHLTKAILDGAGLLGADLTGAHLSGAQLIGAYLEDNAHLNGADLSDADLTNARLTGANLDGANLTGANLNGVDLTGVSHDGDTNTRGATKYGTVGAWW